MSTTRKVFLYLIVILGVLLFIVTLASLSDVANLWWLKVLDFPRLQILITSLPLFFLFLIVNKKWNGWSYAFLMTIVLTIGIQFYYIYPYSILKPETVPTISKEAIDEDAIIDMVVVNVLQKNRKAEPLLRMLDQRNPDIILAMETNQWWEQVLQPIDDKYPYKIEYPLENTFGMVLYSKFKLIDPEIKFLVYDSVPSFHTKIELPTGELVSFHGVHPVPPIPSGPFKKSVKEIALEKVGAMIKGNNLPAIVAGDLNDVAWADATRLFKADSLMHDIREGRKVMPTFNAKNPFFRWPLDYVYVTNDFGVIEFERLEDFGSDHFPVYVELGKLPKALGELK